MKNWVDVVFILALLLSFVQGYRAGFLTTIFTFVGYIGGGLLGLTIGLHHFHFHGVSRFVYLFLAVVIGSSLGEALFRSIGKLFHKKILFAPFSWIDSLLGAAFSILRTAIMLLVLGHLLLVTPWSWVHQIPKSEIYSRLNAKAPSIITDITKRANFQIH
jgi:hypothetical protein